MYVILKDMIARGVRIRRHQNRSDDIVFAVGYFRRPQMPPI
jgi:hypothetical protein